MKKTLALFPGQGSQKVGMGKDLCEQFDLARELFAVADEQLGFSLSNICFNGPSEELTRTEVTQPAILTVSAICYLLARRQGLSLPAAAAGHSLGEYSALVAAEALRFEDAVRLVNKRGRFMQEAVPAGQGAMVAVLGKEPDELENIAQQVEGVVAVANINAPGQIVVAGDARAVEDFVSRLGGARTVPLPVSAPFHCSLMKPAEEQLRRELKDVAISRPLFPIYANYSAQPVLEPEEIRESLGRQVCGRVRWVECMQHAIADHEPDAAVEFGTGNVLTGLLKRIDGAVPRFNLGSKETLEKTAGDL